MILRIVSPIGSKRVTVGERESISSVFGKVENEFKIRNIKLTLKQNGEDEILRNSTLISNLELKHGDILYLQLPKDLNKPSCSDNMEIDGDIKDLTKLDLDQSKSNQVEDDIDKILASQDGRIYRQRNEQYCRHGPSGKCIHCVPLEPYDEEYLEHCDPPIRFMSFHAYLRKLSGGQHQGKFSTLENINCKIRAGCKEHLPWPEGICTKCQPNAVTLSVQKYRHIDNIMFENKSLMDDFLDYWRKTGCQRIGVMFGYYTTFNQAPLGIKAVVAAIYEPPQKSTRKSVELLNLTSGNFLDSAILDTAELLGLRPVGWIFTDLVSNDMAKNDKSNSVGIVKHYRGTIDTYFLTAQECITAGYLQNMFPNKCNLSIDGHYGSKFVTVVVTGDEKNNIHFEGYQVSNQCMALVRDEILVPTFDAPELGYIRESDSNQYVPDVFCGQKDKYGNVVTKIGRPLPVEFLLVHMSVAFPLEELFSLKYRSKIGQRFPIENREAIGELQNVDSVKQYLSLFTEADLSNALSNIHFMWYLISSCTTLPIQEPLRKLLNKLRSIKVKGNSIDQSFKIVKSVYDEFAKSSEWQTVQEILRSHSSDIDHISNPTSGSSTNHDTNKKVWSCIHCTFLNDHKETSCQMCGLPQ